MERIKLSAARREKAGKGLNQLRLSGFVPAILYGKKTTPQMLQVNVKEVEKALRSESGFNTIFDLTLDGKTSGLVRICDHQADPMKRFLTHLDFLTVDLKEKVVVEVPVHIVGKAEGVKLGGILEQQKRTLELKCLVTQIPDHIEIDVTALIIGQAVHANEVKLPEGVEFPHEQNFVIVAVVPPVKEEEAVTTPVEGAAVEGAVEGAPAEGAPAKEGETKEASAKEEKKKA